MCMVRILHMEQVSAFLGMVCSAEQRIYFVQGDGFGFWNHEIHEDGEEDVGSHEVEERFPAGCWSGFMFHEWAWRW